MSEPLTQAPAFVPAGRPGRLRRTLIRAWSLAIMLVIVWTTWVAFAYLIHYVFTPPEPPAWLRENQPPSGPGAPWSQLTTGAGPAPLTPAGHYHRIDRWFRPDSTNSCLASECHDTLPHRARKETRAFANMHSTFADCMLCHDKTVTGPADATWISKRTGHPQQPPAVLSLMRRLESLDEPAAGQQAAAPDEIVALLRATIRETDGDPQLEHLAARIEACEPGSPVWRTAIDTLSDRLPDHARGAYTAKLGLKRDPAEIGGLRKLREQFKASGDGQAKRRILDRIHERVLDQPPSCLTCHGDQPGRLDYEKLGYSPARSEVLGNLPVAKVVQQTRQGEPFHLPGAPDGHAGAWDE